MAIYTMLQSGSEGDAVKKLQQALVDAGYSVGATGVDGIYGTNTTAAVRQYQQDNALRVDGIAGDQTLGSLYGKNTAASYTETVPEAAPAQTAPVYMPQDDGAYQQALTALRQAQQQVPEYQGSYDQELEAVYSQIVGRAPFSYDVNGDALYRQYADQYAAQGKLAMLDTMGQAAALTGGYGNSYAQTLGQQQYGAYLQQLNQAVPELYALALEQYEAQGQALQDRYGMLRQQADGEYSRYQDALDQYWKQVSHYKQLTEDAYDQGYSAWKAERSAADEAYNRLAELIADTGYTPTAAQLQAAGMTQAEAQAYLRRYQGKA